MSVYLHGLAMRADLSANLKLVLAALCDAAGEDDGTKCYPSLAYVAYKTGFSMRHTRRLIRTLEAAHYIEPVAWASGGRGHTTWYRIFIKRVPMKPDWNEVKRRLIEAGELAENDDIPAGAKPVVKRIARQKADILSPISEVGVKADILSPISTVKADILSPISEERRTFCPPSIPIETEDPYRTEDPYGRVSPDQKKPQEGKRDEDALPPPPPPPAHDAAQVWERAARYLRNQPLMTAAAFASWIRPLRLIDASEEDGRLTARLAAPGSEHARIVEQRYHGLLAGALGSVTGLPGSRVTLRFESAVMEVTP